MSANNFAGYDFTAFDGIDTWIFDLDNTLYPPSANLFKQMNEKMSDYVARLLDIPVDEATTLREGYYKEHGTTLRGLMIEHDIHPDDFLEYVHNIDHTWVKPDPDLARAICALPGKRYIFTNGTEKHALAVAERLGITDHIDDIFDIVWADLDPKPNRAPYEKLLSETGLNPKSSAMFEDLARNLKVPHDLGMQTVLMVPGHTQAVFEESWQAKGPEAPHVGFVSDHLAKFLHGILDHRKIDPADLSCCL
jgi:putative hydrolase of the HAD superfamily